MESRGSSLEKTPEQLLEENIQELNAIFDEYQNHLIAVMEDAASKLKEKVDHLEILSNKSETNAQTIHGEKQQQLWALEQINFYLNLTLGDLRKKGGTNYDTLKSYCSSTGLDHGSNHFDPWVSTFADSCKEGHDLYKSFTVLNILLTMRKETLEAKTLGETEYNAELGQHSTRMVPVAPQEKLLAFDNSLKELKNLLPNDAPFKKFLKKVQHVLRNIITLGQHGKERREKLGANLGSSSFWNTHREVFIDKLHHQNQKTQKLNTHLNIPSKGGKK